MKKLVLSLLLACGICSFSGCKDVQIFETPPPDHAVEISDTEIQREVYYVKNGTKFAAVYQPAGGVTGSVSRLDSSRVIYFNDDEDMLPIHYEGELVAYASAKANLEKVTLERFKDMGYSLGIYGGVLGEDGYYHISTSKNLCPGSSAQNLFSRVVSSEIRIVSIGGYPIGDYVDPNSGIITNLKENASYKIEFYSGTYYYEDYIVADTHFLQAFEVYRYTKDYINDTINGYMCFNTPTDLKSGYYNINGEGLFLYHDYKRGTVVENESYNVGYYENTAEMVASYSKQYTVSVPYDTKDMLITVKYGNILDAIDYGTEVSGYVVAPDGTGYDMTIDEKEKTLTLSMAAAMAGDWTVHISPKSLDIVDMAVKSNDMLEDTVCEETEFIVPEDASFQMFYADIKGNGDVYGSIIASDGVTYKLSVGEYKDESKRTHKYLYYRMPYVSAGTYNVKIYYYQSQTQIENIQMIPYDDKNNEIIIIE